VEVSLRLPVQGADGETERKNMETPNSLSGRMTEEIMAVFWSNKNPVALPEGTYNRVYSHVLTVLSAYLDKPMPDPKSV